jgi:hypothetical protein
MDIRSGSNQYCLKIDYKGIPFKCGHCHCYGHLAVDCSLTHRKNIWTLKTIPEDNKDVPVGKNINFRTKVNQGESGTANCPKELHVGAVS